MFVAAFLVALLTSILSAYTLFINAGNLYHTFISNNFKRSPTLTLFYVRFVFDVLIAFMNLYQMTFTFMKLLQPEKSLDPYQLLIFYSIYFYTSVLTARGLLVVIITFERTMAVFTPVIYRNYRDKIPNIVFVLIAIGWNGVDGYMLWIYCAFDFNFPPGCLSMGCIFGDCFLAYGLQFEMVVHSIVATTSMVLATKLFIWNNCKKGATKSKDLERANYLALIDTFTILGFDVIPSILVTVFPVLESEEYGSFFWFARLFGYALEGFLVRRALKRQYGGMSSAKNSMSKKLSITVTSKISTTTTSRMSIAR